MSDAVIRTYTGARVNLLAPQVEDINLTDIAMALSRITRWNGHTDDRISVAQHSVEVYKEVAKRTSDSQFLLYALMHDAAEAYIGDIVSPLKPFITNFDSIEAGIMTVIAKRFGFEDALIDANAVRMVKRADNMVLINEARCLVYNSHYFEELLDSARGKGITKQQVLDMEKIQSFTSEHARRLFNEAFDKCKYEFSDTPF